MEQIFLALGSNLGDRLKNIEKAIAALTRGQRPGEDPPLQKIKVSAIYEAQPWSLDQPDQGVRMVPARKPPESAPQTNPPHFAPAQSQPPGILQLPGSIEPTAAPDTGVGGPCRTSTMLPIAQQPRIHRTSSPKVTPRRSASRRRMLSILSSSSNSGISFPFHAKLQT